MDKSFDMSTESGLMRLPANRRSGRGDSTRKAAASPPPISMIPHSRLPKRDRDRIYRAAAKVISSGQVLPSGNPFIAEFEKCLGRYLGHKETIATGSGSMALLVALKSILEREGKIVTSVFSYVAAAAAIIHAGSIPSFVDIDEDTLQGDESAVLSQLDDTSVVGILPVHLTGGFCAWTAARAKARRLGLAIIDDSAQRLAPGLGLDTDAICFSLGITKEIMGYGEAGAIAFTDGRNALRARPMLRNGNEGNFHYSEIGYNGNIDALLAAICSTNVESLREWTLRRREIGQRYSENFYGCQHIRLPRVDSHHVAYRYCLLVDEGRDELVSYLSRNGFDVSIQYPEPLHLQPCFAKLGYQRGDFPVAERISKSIITLPNNPWITDAEVDRLSEYVLGFVDGRRLSRRNDR
jgi:UDP-2-acetamido-2-deoxy-ribo-hexuluronate aminotransferase